MGTEQRLYIKPSERVAAVGMTGCGKTTLVKRYLSGFTNVMVLDTKGTFKWGNVPIITTFDDLKKKSDGMDGRFIYRPVDRELNADFYEAFFEYCYKRRNTFVNVDELAQIAESATDILPSWKDIMQRGRELNVGIANCTQRPKFVPRMTFSESEHTFCFRLKLEDDRRTMAEFMGQEILRHRLQGHGFYYSHESMENPVLVPNGIPL